MYLGYHGEDPIYTHLSVAFIVSVAKKPAQSNHWQAFLLPISHTGEFHMIEYNGWLWKVVGNTIVKHKRVFIPVTVMIDSPPAEEVSFVINGWQKVVIA